MKKSFFLFIACVVYCAVVNAQDVQKDMRYVDLGLPSGILWADQNEAGVYTFEETVEKFRGKEMPGMDAFKELVDICTWTWNGTGYTIVGPSGDSILLPLLPIKDCQGNMENNPTTGRYWSAEVYDELEGWGLYFDENKVWTTMSFIKCMALPVRKIKHPAREFQIPDYEGIQQLGEKKYKALMKRFLAEDTTLSLRDVQAVYYGSAFYGTRSDNLGTKKLNEAYESGGPEALVALLDSHLVSNPLDIEGIVVRYSMAMTLKDAANANKYGYMYAQLANAIGVTGDGDSEYTAIHVVTVADEYALMNFLMDVQPEMQTLTNTMCDMFDATTKSGRKIQVYFDVQLVLALENHMFSSDKKPFHFIYKKLE